MYKNYYKISWKRESMKLFDMNQKWVKMSEKSGMIKKEYTLSTEIRNDEQWIKIILHIIKKYLKWIKIILKIQEWGKKKNIFYKIQEWLKIILQKSGMNKSEKQLFYQNEE